MEIIEIVMKLIKYIQRALLMAVMICTLNAVNLEAVEPDESLYDEKVDARDTTYATRSQQLLEKIDKAKEGKKVQMLLVQQQLLNKLRELPDKAEQPSNDEGLFDLNDRKKLQWQDVEQYLERYIGVIGQEKLSTQNLESTQKRKETLHRRLIALPENSDEENILQLQHAYQVRKLVHLKELDKHLKMRLEKAKDGYPQILDRINVDAKMVDVQAEKARRAREQLQRLEDEQILASPGEDAGIEQQESLLAGYLGQELGDDEKKEMHYEQLKLLELQTQKLSGDSQIFEANINFLQEEQKVLWFRLFGTTEEYFKLTDLSGDIDKKVSRLRKEAAHAQIRKYTYEKELSSLRGGNALIGPKSEELVMALDNRLSKTFTVLSGVYQQAEMLENKGRLLAKAIDLKQSALGSMVTKTREATDDIYEKAIHVLKYPIVSYSGMTFTLLLFLQIVVLLIFGIIINRLYGHVVMRMGRKRKWTERTIQLVHAVGKYPFIFLVAMVILSVVGISTSSLALVAGALSVGIGFGMQTIVNNLVSGIILLFDKSIRPGDFISLGEYSQTGGHRGNVVQMNIRATVLRTNDNINIIIPNADLMASQVVNWTYSDEKIRFRIPFSVAYGSEIDTVKAVVKKAVLDLPVVLSLPEPQIWMAAHAESSLSFLAAIWVEGQNARRPSYTFDIVLSAIYKTLAEHGIEIPMPQMDLRLRNTEHQSVEINSMTESIQNRMFAEARN